ncbi:ABC transporter permease [Streptomyces sp. FIT100]|uniref:ABC transporter permease n=1 Tax=Streptomyces sp. FIT100 TaxID=2837956 RepID=UPI0021C87FDB|nr:ABC transporter permease [Streptomyces sp. FIT100]
MKRGLVKSRLPFVVLGVFFLVLYAPIAAVVLFSFNAGKSLSAFSGFSLRWYREFFSDGALTGSVATSVQVAAVAMAGSVVLGTAMAVGASRVRGRFGAFAGFVTLIPLLTPEIVTGVASLLLFKGLGITPSLLTLILAEITFSVSYVAVILRARLAALNPEVEEAAMDLGATRWQALRLVTLPALAPVVLAAAILVFALVFDDFVLAAFTSGTDDQPLPVRIYSAMRFGIRPSINAVGTVMLAGSAVLIALALALPRLFGRRGTGLDLLSGE